MTLALLIPGVGMGASPAAAPAGLVARTIAVLGRRDTTFTVPGQRGTTVSVLGSRSTATVSVEGSLAVAIRTDFDVHRSEDVNIDFDIDESIVGWALRLSLISMSGTELVYKTIGSGITITSGAAGTGRGVFDSADLDRTMTSYRWSLARTDTGYKAVLAYGLVNILPPEALP